LFKDLASLDGLIFMLYLIFLLGIGFYYSRKEKNLLDYFLAGKNTSWIAIGTSLFAASFLNGQLLNLGGVGIRYSYIIACIVLIMLGWILVPLYSKIGVFTAPEFLEIRYNKSCRLYVTGVYLLSYILIRLSITLYIGSLLLHEIMGFDIAVAAIIIVIIAGIFAISGGMKTIIPTDVLNSVFIIGGITVLALSGLTLPFKTFITSNHWFNNSFVSNVSPQLPIESAILIALVLGIWYWSLDQFVVQRVISGRNTEQARGGVLLAAFLVIFSLLIFFVPRTSAGIIDQNREALGGVISLSPGFAGIILAALFGVLISSLISCFNSCATLFTMDYYRLVRPNSSERELVLVGRLATTVVAVLGLLYVPCIRFMNFDTLIKLQIGLSYFVLPIIIIFFSGLFWHRLNGHGAFIALIGGAAISLVKIIAELFYQYGLSNNWIIQSIARLHFFKFVFILAISFLFIFISISYLSAPPDKNNRLKLTENQIIGNKNSLAMRINIGLSILLVPILIYCVIS
jgi:solute:Na+ symporter, SSS family